MRVFKYIYTLFLLAVMASCYEEDLGFSPEYNGEGLSLTFQSDKFLPYQVASRVSDPKLEAEKRINSLHVFFFDQAGNYLRGKYLTGYDTQNESGGYYSPSQGVSILKIDHSPEAFDNPTNAKSARIVAVANVYEGFFEGLDETFCPANIKNIYDLINKPYKPNDLTLDIPPSGMPMFGEITCNLTDESVHSLTIPMRALMARVDLTFTIDSEETDASKLLPRLQMADWTVCNRPLSVPFIAPSGISAPLGADKDDKMVKNSSVIYNRNGELKLSFYMFENKRGIADDSGYDYPSNGEDGNGDFTVDDRQRYKPKLSELLPDNGGDDATYVKIHGYYSTYNEGGSGSSTYDVTYKLYLGKDHTKDFNVERNCQYKNNITIKGITATDNNFASEVTLDTRVHVQDSNPFYVSILRERNHDAHFCVTPMDIYMFDDGGTSDNVRMKVRVENPDVNNWLRLEMVTADQMYRGDAPNDKCYASKEEFKSGNGKRKYFTTNLLNELDSEVILETSRDRVYIYIDENLNKNLTRRDANLILEYTGKDGTTIKKNLVIGQLPLIKVKCDVYDIYMEQIEEYLNHYDPLDKFDDQQMYPGLPWGIEGTWNELKDLPKITVGKDEYTNNIVENYYWGWWYSAYLVNRMGQSVLELNKAPSTALQYCYNRNKRKDDGTVPFAYKTDFYWPYKVKITENEAKWFLPAIREMERALTQEYNNFPEFKQNFYWSCAIGGEKKILGTEQDKNRARATKVKPDGTHWQSGRDYPYDFQKGGYAKRNEIIRIRAFRVDLEPVNY